MIAVLHYHKFLSPDKRFLVIEHLSPDAGVVAVRALVGPAQHDCIILGIFREICLVQGLQEFSACDTDHIVETRGLQTQLVSSKKLFS